MLQGDMKNKEQRIHPTQKPVKLYQWLLDNYAKPGQRILDTHMGSGSSAIAAHYFGCDFVGCEIDPDYYKAAKERFERVTRQEAMF
jgi:site-specific DNA-methyltransferase (adenine-specific)